MDQALYDINNESSLCYDSDYGRLLCNDDCTKIVLCLGNQRDIIVENCLPSMYFWLKLLKWRLQYFLYLLENMK